MAAVASAPMVPPERAGGERDGGDGACLGHCVASFSAPVGFSSGPDSMRHEDDIVELLALENDGLHWPRHDGLKWPHSRRLLLALMFPHCPVGLQHWRPGRAVVEMFYQRACSSTGDRRGHTVSFVP